MDTRLSLSPAHRQPGFMASLVLLVAISYTNSVQSKWQRMCAETYGAFRRSPHICTVYGKSLTAESGLEGTRKSARISASIICMKIGPFVSYIEWLGEIGSVGCVFRACSVPFVRLIQRGHFFPKLYALYFLWN